MSRGEAGAPVSDPRPDPITIAVIPTLNEAGNIQRLLPALLGMPRLRVVVVDDDSSDGTAEFVAALAGQDARVRLVRRSGEVGYGSACLRGFREALEWGADHVLQMDSDLSHDPASIPEFLRLAEHCDVVQGCRYMPGGGIVGWGPLRRSLSRWGNRYARWILGLPVRDCTGGFRLYHRAVLESLRLDAIRSNGYAFLSEMLYHCHAAGWRIVETPIVFRNRTVGRSKISLRIVLEAAWRVPATRLSVHRQALYGAAGAGTGFRSA